MNTSERSLRPFLVVGLLLALPPGVMALQRLNHWAAPVLFSISIIGILSVIVIHVQDERKMSGKSTSIRYESLAAIEVSSFVPWLKQNVRGHDAIIDGIVHELQRNLQLSKPGRHLGAFLLVGPTGTGKTFLASLIGQALFRQSEVVVLRMNQYKHPNDVFTFLGPPPGMPGYEIGGALTRPVLENPQRVIILDELEKA